MSIFCPRCKTKHPQRECLLNNIFVCHICTKEQATDNCPSFPRLQAIYKSGMKLKHIGDLLGNLETNQHIQTFHHNLHSIILRINYLNNGTILDGKIGHLGILLLNFHNNNIGHNDGEENHILSYNLFLHLIILILRIKQISINAAWICTSSSFYHTTTSSLLEWKSSLTNIITFTTNT